MRCTAIRCTNTVSDALHNYQMRHANVVSDALLHSLLQMEAPRRSMHYCTDRYEMLHHDERMWFLIRTILDAPIRYLLHCTAAICTYVVSDRQRSNQMHQYGV